LKPLYDALIKYSDNASAVFHMPGHKLGRGFIPRNAFNDPARFDVTEIDETDDLHCPQGPLLEAQALAARAFGAGKTWFLVNGSSCGIFAMIAAICKAGQKLLIARDFHYSAYNAMRFARVKPVYISVSDGSADMDASIGAVDVKSVEKALSDHPDAAALYITRPGYYGGVCDIAGIARLTRERGVPLLVDEAHGAHLCFSERLPAGALEGGADYCVQSAHKTLPAFTQCAYAHVSARSLNENGARAARFSEALRVFQTSSPSFILTASLDYAREYMEFYGTARLDMVLDQCEIFYKKMAEAGYGIPADIFDYKSTDIGCGIPADILDDLPADASGVISADSCNVMPIDASQRHCDHPKKRFARDMTRLVIDTSRIGLSGIEADKLLWTRHKIKVEMADPRHIVMITTVADSDADFLLLRNALKQIAAEHKNRAAYEKSVSHRKVDKNDAPQPISGNLHAERAGNNLYAASFEDLTPREAANDAPKPIADCDRDYVPVCAPDFISQLHAPRRFLPLNAALGKRAADIVTPYPPGIPLLCPGELISKSAIDRINALLDSGSNIKGLKFESGESDRPDCVFIEIME